MWWFDGWEGVARVAVVGVAAYASLVALLRVTGKRTLSKLNAFDLVVTVALGSTLATILLSADVAFAEGLAALALLVLLQYAVTWTSVRFPAVQSLVKAQPTLLVSRGRVLDGALRAQRVTREELLAAVRTSGMSRIEDADAVVLETDGSLTAMRSAAPGAGALAPVDRAGGGATPSQR
jgi:uncharacterized membrane protein YcaP (DUF421 family)